MDPHTHLGQSGDGGGDVDRVPAQPIQLGDDQHVILLELVQQLDEARPLLDGGTARHRLGDDTAWVDLESGGFDLLDLVLCGLTGGGNPDVGEGARHGRNSCPKSMSVSATLSVTM